MSRNRSAPKQRPQKSRHNSGWLRISGLFFSFSHTAMLDCSCLLSVTHEWEGRSGQLFQDQSSCKSSRPAGKACAYLPTAWWGLKLCRSSPVWGCPLGSRIAALNEDLLLAVVRKHETARIATRSSNSLRNRSANCSASPKLQGCVSPQTLIFESLKRALIRTCSSGACGCLDTCRNLPIVKSQYRVKPSLLASLASGT